MIGVISRKDILAKAAELTHVYGWTKGAMARLPAPEGYNFFEGHPTSVTSGRATCFCSIGFIERAVYELRANQEMRGFSVEDTDVDGAYNTVRKIIGKPSISTWNDAEATGLEQVRATLEQARDAA